MAKSKKAAPQLKAPAELITEFEVTEGCVLRMPVQAAEAIDEGTVAMQGIAPPRSRWSKICSITGA